MVWMYHRLENDFRLDNLAAYSMDATNFKLLIPDEEDMDAVPIEPALIWHTISDGAEIDILA